MWSRDRHIFFYVRYSTVSCLSCGFFLDGWVFYALVRHVPVLPNYHYHFDAHGSHSQASISSFRTFAYEHPKRANIDSTDPNTIRGRKLRGIPCEGTKPAHTSPHHSQTKGAILPCNQFNLFHFVFDIFAFARSVVGSRRFSNTNFRFSFVV